MSGGKQAARDTRWGRRGGRWADGDRVDVALVALANAREKGLAGGTWPDGTPKGDRECRVCGVPIGGHSPPCVICGRSPEHHTGDDLAVEMAGKARMDAARAALDDHSDDEEDKHA